MEGREVRNSPSWPLEVFRSAPAPKMMFPGLLCAPAGYPSLLRPTPTLTLPQSLQSAFSGHSSFLVEDLIRTADPPAYLPRGSVPTPSMSPPRPGAPAALTDTGAPDLGLGARAARRGGSPQTAASPASEPTFLKFGRNAILSSAPRTGKEKQNAEGCSDLASVSPYAAGIHAHSGAHT